MLFRSVVFTLPQQALPAVSTAMASGMPEVLAVTPENAGTPAVLDRGQLAVLDNQVDPQTGTIKLKATFPNRELALWPGQFTTVRVAVDTQCEITPLLLYGNVSRRVLPLY